MPVVVVIYERVNYPGCFLRPGRAGLWCLRQLVGSAWGRLVLVYYEYRVILFGWEGTPPHSLGESVLCLGRKQVLVNVVAVELLSSIE
jgi:hypothetical protein